jgi:hypothetical protein
MLLTSRFAVLCAARVWLQEKEKLYVELKGILARQPGPEVAEQLSIYQVSAPTTQVPEPQVIVHYHVSSAKQMQGHLAWHRRLN